MWRFWWWVLILGLSCAGCSHDVPWEEFKSQEGVFRVEFPGHPTQQFQHLALTSEVSATLSVKLVTVTTA